MPEIISATFETPDMADFALMRLRSEKIIFDTCKIDGRERDLGEKHVGMIVNPYDTARTTTMSNDLSAVGTIGQYGGFLYTVEDGKGSDVTSTEVRMSIRVHSAQVDRAKASLRSCHGRGLTIGDS